VRNIALILMYNGTAYHGWQVQKTEVTVAQTLERGLSMVCGEPVKCTGCGRTDAGVHAEHYVANFRTSSRIPVDRIPFAVNTHIPEDIVSTPSAPASGRSIPIASTIHASRIPFMWIGHIFIPSGWTSR